MKRILVALIACIMPAASTAATAADADAAPTRYVIPSWGDMTLVYGPGTDPAMDTAEAMERMVAHWKGRGFTGMYLRTDLSQAVPGSIIRHPATTPAQPELAVAWRLIDEIMEKSDPHMAARRAADKVGFEYWMWHPYLYSEGAPADVGVPGEGRMVPWSYVRRYHAEHPEVITIDRKGNRQWMVPEYAYPGARADKVAEFVHMAKTYRPTGILASLRSEASQLLPPPAHGDQYGFNPPIVDQMKRLHGVDILTDARFDWQSPTFNPADPTVENWRSLRGSYLTQLVREIRQGLREVDPKIQLAMTVSGDHVGPVLGNWTLEWRKWVDEGLVDVLVMPVFFEATPDPDSAKKGYLTNLLASQGAVSATDVKAYIAKSKHPEIRLIHTGAPSYFYPPPPAGADGWQCDAWYDAYHLAWFQRWDQWMRDVRELGHIQFIEQNFDAFPVRNAGTGGGWGDMRHNPDLRACPGVWHRLGDGSDARPVVQSDTRRGDAGNAVLLTTEDFIARHTSSPDRAGVTAMVDTAIANGTATFECWVYRDDERSSLTAHVTGDVRYEKDVGLRVEPGTGRVAYASGSEWIATDVQLEPRTWHRLAIEVDVDRLTYAAFAGAGPLCKDVKIAPAPDRLVSQPTVNVPTKMPSFRVFNVLYFIPDKAAGNRVFLDDVSVRWKPTLHFVEPGKTTVLSETFEQHAVGTPPGSKAQDLKWRVEPAASAGQFSIENTTSFGPGVKCLRAAGGGAIVGDLAPARGDDTRRMTLDLDVFVRSDKDFPYILPDPTTRSRHSTVISISGADADKPVASVTTGAGGTWLLWDGKAFVDTGKPVAYDVWNHVQLAVDVPAKRYTLVVQPVGELPTLVGTAAWGQAPAAKSEKLTWKINPSATDGHASCYDNVVVTLD